MQQLLADGARPPLPPLWRGEHLLGYLWEAGPVMGGGMEAAPLTFGELAAWQRAAGIELQPWEATLLRRLSREYAAEAAVAGAADRPAPYTTAPTIDRDDLSRRLSREFRAMAMAQRSRIAAS